MDRCPSCEYPLPGDRDRLGARCPRCRDPLYEPATRVSRDARDGEGSCALHAGAEAVGLCARCGNYMCEVCRTRWRGQIICAGCVQKALDTREAAPEAVRGHLTQSVLGLVLGIAAWVLMLVGTVIAALAGAAGGGAQAVLGLLMLACLLGALLLGVAALGNAAAAVRTRGRALVLATVGLVISGLQVGTFIGLFVFGLWQQ